MAITPTGSPPWVRNSDHATYGGSTTKANYQAQGVTNPRTDVSAEAYVRMATDTAALSRTGAIGLVTFTPDDAGANDPTVDSCDLMTGNSTNYDGGAAPTGFPAVERVSDGIYDVTMPASLTDEYSVSAAVSIVHAEGSGHGGTAAIVNCDITAVNIVRVYVFDTAGAALADIKLTIEIA